MLKKREELTPSQKKANQDQQDDNVEPVAFAEVTSANGREVLLQSSNIAMVIQEEIET